MTKWKKSRKLFSGLTAVSVIVCGTYMWSYAATSCTCDNRADIRAFYNKQIAHQNEYMKQREAFQMREYVMQEPYNWSGSRNNAMMVDVSNAGNAIKYDPTAWQISANTTAIGCKIDSYTWLDPGPPSTKTTGMSPPACIKELVDAHEQVHIDECNRSFISLFYKWSKTMVETAEEEIKATSTGMDKVLKVKDDLMRQFCCDTDLTPFIGAKNNVHSLKTIIANLFGVKISRLPLIDGTKLS